MEIKSPRIKTIKSPRVPMTVRSSHRKINFQKNISETIDVTLNSDIEDQSINIRNNCVIN